MAQEAGHLAGGAGQAQHLRLWSHLNDCARFLNGNVYGMTWMAGDAAADGSYCFARPPYYRRQAP